MNQNHPFTIHHSLFTIQLQKSPNFSPLCRSFAPMKKWILLVIVSNMLAMTVKAQTTDRTAFWYGSINSIHLNKKWSIQPDFHIRSTDKWEHVQTFILRPAISYRFNPKWNVVLGYNHIQSRVSIGGVSGYTPENHIWEQVWFRHKWKKFNLVHRISLEQRFIQYGYLQNGQIKNREALFTQRFRYLFRAQLPLVHQKPTFVKGPYAVLQDEIFFNMLKKENANGQAFDQNRLFAGLGYRLSPKFDIEAGYQNRAITARGGARFTDHITQITTFLRL